MNNADDFHPDFTQNNGDTVQLSAVIVIARSTQEAIVVNCRQLYPLSKPGTSS
jgi:protein-tyrosine phosphatase